MYYPKKISERPKEPHTPEQESTLSETPERRGKEKGQQIMAPSQGPTTGNVMHLRRGTKGNPKSTQAPLPGEQTPSKRNYPENDSQPANPRAPEFPPTHGPIAPTVKLQQKTKTHKAPLCPPIRKATPQIPERENPHPKA